MEDDWVEVDATEGEVELFRQISAASPGASSLIEEHVDLNDEILSTLLLGDI